MIITEKEKNRILFFAAQAGIWERAGFDTIQAIEYFSGIKGADALYYKGSLKSLLLSREKATERLKLFKGKIREDLFNKLEELAEWQPLFALLFEQLFNYSYISINAKKGCLSLGETSQRKFYNLFKTVPVPKDKGRIPLKLHDLDDLLGLTKGTMKSTSGGPKATKGTLENIRQEFGHVLPWLL